VATVTVLLADLAVNDGTAVVPARSAVEVTPVGDGVELYFASRTGRRVSGTIRLDAGACRDLYVAIEDALT
jgi:hypothetical protein